jgi:tetratricopeptide (TPR) repeat protein
MIPVSDQAFYTSFKAYEDTQAVLQDYERTRDPALLSHLRSLKPACETAVETWLSMLENAGDGNPMRDVVLMGLSMMYRMLGGAHMYLNESADAIACYESAYDVGLQIGEVSEIVQPLNNLGILSLEAGDFPSAEEYFRQAISHLDAAGEAEFGPTLRRNLDNARARHKGR